jgi:CheY-like chemotaxis protein
MGRVLVVDDEAPVRDGLKSVLTAHRHEVRTAVDGAAAVEAFDQFQPDVVVCDLLMANVDGVSAIYNIRLRDPNVPILAITGCHLSGKHEPLAAAEQLGVQVMLKPFPAPQFLDAVTQLMKPKATRN